MKKSLSSILIMLFLMINLCSCQSINSKSTSFSIIYGVSALISLLLLIACFFLVKKNKLLFLMLYGSVLVINIGYTLLSISNGLEMALWANRIAYLGSVFLSPAMLLIILKVTSTNYKKALPLILLGIALPMYLIAASPGILDIYYKDVTFEIIEGSSSLIKVYGPLHPLYLFYLLGYFITMIVVIIRAAIRKSMESTTHSVILALAVFVNIGVWFIEQLTDIDFEMLSISYIISELFLLCIHLIITENQRLQVMAKQLETIQYFSDSTTQSSNILVQNIDISQLEMFTKGIEKLTATEHAIYDSYIARLTTKEIMSNLNITENTLKYHNKNIYSKLGVSSRKELLEIYKRLKYVKEHMNTDK